MIYAKIQVPVPGGSVTVTAYAPDNSPEIELERTRPAMVICPGGGYGFRSDREAEPIALEMLSADICAFVVSYSIAPARYPAAVTELAAAVSYVREHAGDYHVNPNQIAVMGFSAGGHLAASLGVRWHEPWLSASLGKTAEAIRPNGMVLCYPVITGGPFTHQGSMINLLGTEDQEAWKAQSLEELVTEQTAPAFLWHTYTDDAVPVENSLMFFTNMRRSGVPGELHIYPDGCHGLSLANNQVSAPAARERVIRPEVQNWIGMAARWTKSL